MDSQGNFVKSIKDAVSCKSCTPGTASNVSEDKTTHACSPCAAGKFSDAFRSEECKECEPGMVASIINHNQGSLLHINTLHVIIKPGGWNWEICPGGWIRLVWTTDPGGEIPSKSQIRVLERIVYTSRFSSRKHFFVIITPTISMCQNCSISVLVDPGGAKKKLSYLVTPRV